MRSSSPGTNRCLWVAAPVLPDLMSFILLAKNCDLSVAFNLDRGPLTVKLSAKGEANEGWVQVLVEDGRGREPGSPGDDEVAVVVGLGFVRLLSGLSAASGRVMCFSLGSAEAEKSCVSWYGYP